jgi:hypothetical protein
LEFKVNSVTGEPSLAAIHVHPHREVMLADLAGPFPGLPLPQTPNFVIIEKDQVAYAPVSPEDRSPLYKDLSRRHDILASSPHPHRLGAVCHGSNRGRDPAVTVTPGEAELGNTAVRCSSCNSKKRAFEAPVVSDGAAVVNEPTVM